MTNFVGIPYLSGGRDLDGLDCWGLVLCAAKELFCLDYPIYLGYTNAEAQDETEPYFSVRKSDWKHIPVGSEVAGDVIVLYIAGRPTHCGLVIEKGMMLHTLANHDSVIERYLTRRWITNTEGFYRWSQVAA